MPGTANPNNFLHLDIHRPPRIDHLKAKVTFRLLIHNKKKFTKSKLDKEQC